MALRQLRAARALRLIASSTAPPTLQKQLDAVRRSLDWGLESAATVEASASTLYLETDAAARQPRRAYVERYQRLACGELKGALASLDTLREAHGAEAVEEALKGDAGLRLALAEAQLARDRLEAGASENRRKQEANVVECD